MQMQSYRFFSSALVKSCFLLTLDIASRRICQSAARRKTREPPRARSIGISSRATTGWNAVECGHGELDQGVESHPATTAGTGCRRSPGRWPSAGCRNKPGTSSPVHNGVRLGSTLNPAHSPALHRPYNADIAVN
eukprot:1492606-Rhodomonas_salina.5